jgi:hypothetical protein
VGSETTTQQVAPSGRPEIDALAAQRVVANPETRECASCQQCGALASRADLWRVTWSYYYEPSGVWSLALVVGMLTGAMHVHGHFREVRHHTYHVICTACGRAIRRGRVIAVMLRFVGLFIAICALAVSAAGIAWWFIAGAHDRNLIKTWIAVPLGALVAGLVVVRIGKSMSVPSAIRPLLHRPFHATRFSPAAENPVG